jgi:cyclase
MKKLLARIGAIVAAVLTVLGVVGYTQILGVTTSAKVKDNVHLVYNTSGFSRIGANVVAIDAGDAWVVFDTHLGPLSKGAFKQIKSMKDMPVRYAFNSHWHPDHSGGNAAFTDEAEIVSHGNVRSILASVHEGFGLTSPGSYREYNAIAREALPETMISSQSTFSVGALQLNAVHYPSAHTNGDLVLFVDQLKIVVIGDLVWPAGFPFIDVHSGGSANGVREALQAIVTRTDDQYLYIMGHGDPFTADQLQEYLSMVEKTISYVEKQKASGKTLEEVQSQGLPEKWRTWETKLNPQEVWIRMIYDTL